MRVALADYPLQQLFELLDDLSNGELGLLHLTHELDVPETGVTATVSELGVVPVPCVTDTR